MHHSVQGLLEAFEQCFTQGDVLQTILSKTKVVEGKGYVHNSTRHKEESSRCRRFQKLSVSRMGASIAPSTVMRLPV